MILSLQYCKLHRKGNEYAQEWMDRLIIKVAECNYKEHDTELKEQFINSINDEDITQEIIKLLTAQKNTGEIDSEQVLMWAKELRCRGDRTSTR